MSNQHAVDTAAAVRRMEDVRQVAARIGRGSSWIWAAVKRGDMPSPKKLSARCTRWDSRDIDRWIEQQFSEESR